MGVAGVAGDQVEQDAHITLVGFVQQMLEVLHGAVARGYPAIVAYVVARVHERRIIYGIEPYGVASETLDIIELQRDAAQVAYAVGIGIVKALGIYLIKNTVA